MVRAIILVANGTEEIEAVVPIDILRRANVSVLVLSVEDELIVKCARETQIKADAKLRDLIIADLVNEYDCLVLPGGLQGAKTFASNFKVQELLAACNNNKILLGLICAAPLALIAAKIGKGQRITSHPSIKHELEHYYNYETENVVVDNHLITSRGPGTAFLFSFQLVQELMGPEVLAKVKEPMMIV